MIRLLAILAAALVPAALQAAPAVQLVEDINHTVQAPQQGGGPVAFGSGWLASFCRDGTTTSGNTLLCDVWFTDGSTSGARVVKSFSVDPTYGLGGFAVMGGYAYFLQIPFPTSQAGQLNLWRTDGTTAGTVLVTTMSGAPATRTPMVMAATDSLLFLRGASDHLWRSDGTAAGTFEVASMQVTQLTTGGGRAWFAASGTSGNELYVSDGSVAGTTLVKDIATGTSGTFPASSNPTTLTFLGGKLYFWASDASVPSLAPWSSDGTDAGTVKLASMAASQYAPFVAFSGKTYFLSQEAITGATGKLWSSDGTAAGTVVVSSSFGSLVGGTGLVPAGGRLYFAGTAALWSSDGTGAGMARIALPTTTSSVSSLAAAGNDLYASVNDTQSGRANWKVASGGTTAVKTTIDSRLFPWMALGSQLLLDGQNGVIATLDGNGAPVPLPVAAGQPTSGSVCTSNNQVVCCTSNTVVVAAYAYFAADDGVHGCELWRTDGTANGTSLVIDVVPGYENGMFQGAQLYAAGPYVYMLASNATGTYDLWRTDGTSAGSVLLQSYATDLPSIVAQGSALLVSTYSDVWRFDPGAAARVVFTRPSTTLTISAIKAGEHFIVADLSGPSGDRLFGNDGNGGAVTDLGAMNPFALNGTGSLPGCALFVKSDNINPPVMWRTDGTALGTFALGQALTNAQSSSATGRFYYLNSTGLMESDCSVAGTRAVAPLPPASPPNYTLDVAGSTVWLRAPGYSTTDIYAWYPGSSAMTLVGSAQGVIWSFVPSERTAFYVNSSDQLGMVDLSAGASIVDTFDGGPNAPNMVVQAMLPAHSAWTNTMAPSVGGFNLLAFASRNGLGWEPYRVASDSSEVNYALAYNGGVASASSQLSASFPVGAVNDGEPAGLKWSAGGGWADATSGQFPDWVQIVFDSPKPIDKVVVYTLQDNWGNPVEPGDSTTFTQYGITAFDVQALVGGQWTTVGTVTGNTLVKRMVTFAPVMTSAIRVVVNGALGGFSRITEIEAWGAASFTPPPLATTVVSLSSSANPSFGGQPVTFVATLQETDLSGAPSGTVTFLDNGSPIAGCSNVPIADPGITARCTVALLPYAHTITASYSGDGRYSPATSSPYTQTLLAGLWTNVALYSTGADATASSEFSPGFPAQSVINGDTTGFDWSFGGGWADATPGAYPDWVQVAFGQMSTITSVVVYTLQDNWQAPVPPTDTMTFTQYGVTAFDVQAWNGTAWVTVASVTGNNLVKRTVTFAPVVTSKIRVVVNAALSSLSRVTEVEAWGAFTGGGGGTTMTGFSLISSANPATIGAPVTLSATIGPGTATGTVTFSEMEAAIPACANVALVNNIARCTTTFPAGTHILQATYNGDAVYSSVGTGITQVVEANTGARINAALASNGGTASASSQFNAGFPVSAVINGDATGAGWTNGGGWADGSPGAYPDWVEVDFAQPTTLDSVVVYTLQDNWQSPSQPVDFMTFTKYGVTAFDLQYWDGSTWRTTMSITRNNLVKRTISSTPITTSKIRVVVNGTIDGISRITEIEAWGVPATALATPSVALTPSANPATWGSPVTLTAAVSGTGAGPTGAVTFYDGFFGAVLCANVALSGGTAACTTSAMVYGLHWITAVYSGDAAYGTATSTMLYLPVNVQEGVTAPILNFALASNGGRATASSQYGNTTFPASAVIDGDAAGTGWSAGGGWADATPGQYPDWVEVDLPIAGTIDHVVVYTLQDNWQNPSPPTDTMTFTQHGVTAFDVQTWTTDGRGWVTIARVSDNNLVKRTVAFSPVITSRLRIVVRAALNSLSRITEVEAWSVAGSSGNVASGSMGSTASASSQLSASFPVSAVIDGERAGANWGNGGGWADATSGQYPDWVEVDFHATRTIHEVDVYTLQDNWQSPVEPVPTMTFAQYGVTDFTVQAWDGTQWLTIGTVSNNNLVRRSVPVWAVTSKIRVNVTHALSSLSRMTEIEAWGN